MSSYRPFVETLVKSVVTNPDDVTIDEETEMGTRTFFVTVSPEDVGKVIGKSGRVVAAIRCVRPLRRQNPRAARHRQDPA